MKNIETIANALWNELNRGTEKHPTVLPFLEMANMIAQRAEELATTAGSTADAGYEERTGTLCLKTAVLAIRMIRDNDLLKPDPTHLPT